MNSNTAKQLLLSSEYWVLNKNFVKVLGLETAFVLANLAEADKILSDNEGWFYQTAETLEEISGLSRHKQDRAIKELRKLGIIEQKNKGIPMKRYFKLHTDVMISIVFKNFENLDLKNSQPSIENFDNLEFKNFKTSKESIIKKIDKQSINKNISSNGFDEERFNKFWELYDKKVGKQKAIKEWKKLKLTDEEIGKLMKQVKLYTKATEKKFRKDPERYLKHRAFEDEIISNNFKGSARPIKNTTESYASRELRRLKEQEELEWIG